MGSPGHSARRWCCLAFLLLAALGAAPQAASATSTVREGNARFQVLSPTLIRLEYAADGRFEDRSTLTVVNRRFPDFRFSTRVVDGWRQIRTRRVTVRYLRGSGPFGEDNLKVRVGVGDRTVEATPRWKDPPGNPLQPPPIIPAPMPDLDPAPATRGNLGGWYRGVDNQRDPVELHEGILSRDGWYLLDDSFSPILDRGTTGFSVRPGHAGAYQDGYLFAYGHDYLRALRDFRRLTGPAPLLPRKAFGVWFSRYWPYGQRDFSGEIVPSFRRHRVPLDILVVDTDFKLPHVWNGWMWRPDLYPDPEAFFDWAHSAGLEVSLNVHPSIADDDPRYGEADRRAGGLLVDTMRCRFYLAATDVRPPPLTCGVFDLARPEHVESYWWLHEPFERDGVDFWWLDWCCDQSQVSGDGVTPDTVANLLYQRRSRARGERWLSFSRVGGSFFDYHAEYPGAFAEHRYSLHFTGDSFDTWEMLDFQTRFTAAEGAGIGLPYVSHDIGSFHGDHLPDDMYVRWVQSGLVQPLLRLHSDHGDRLPWQYPRVERIASDLLRLRTSLIPYLYTLARKAYDRGLPIARAMYLHWPGDDDAYRHDRQYMLGGTLLAAPVGTPGDPARKTVWFPPGAWVDWYTGERHRGPGTETLSVPLEQMPLFARAGAVVPRAPYMPYSDRRPLTPLIVDVWAGRAGRFRLYEDRGDGFDYRKGGFLRTLLRHRVGRDREALVIGPARGDGFRGDLERRSYVIHFIGVRQRPEEVAIYGDPAGASPRPARPRFGYDPGTDTVTVRTGSLPTDRRAKVAIDL